MSEPILALKNACFSYDGKRNVLQNINVTIREGEHIAVLGNNGSGKSTFFLCLNGVLALTDGEIQLRQTPISRSRKELARLTQEVGYVFQEPDNQIIGSTVESELAFGPLNLNMSKELIQEKITGALKQFSLESYRTTPPHYLSGGEKKRVAIAGIMIMEPNILLLDEPTASLDQKNIASFETLLQQQEFSQLTTLISTHDMDFAFRWADRVLLFHQGQLVADDTPEKIFSDPELIDGCDLKRPMLFDITASLCRKYGYPLPEAIPRTLGEFNDFVERIPPNLT